MTMTGKTMTDRIWIESVPSSADNSWHRELWMRHGVVHDCDLDAALDRTVQRLEARTRRLMRIRELRHLLIGTHGWCTQAYRDEWSDLCTELLEDGRPVLTDVSAGNHVPAEVLL